MDMVLEQKTELSRRIEEHTGADVTLDLEGVTFMDSSGIGLLIGLRRLCQERGKSFRIVQAAPPIRKLFDSLRLTEYLTVTRPTETSPAS